jgi:hypothetical protein
MASPECLRIFEFTEIQMPGKEKGSKRRVSVSDKRLSEKRGLLNLGPCVLVLQA